MVQPWALRRSATARQGQYPRYHPPSPTTSCSRNLPHARLGCRLAQLEIDTNQHALPATIAMMRLEPPQLTSGRVKPLGGIMPLAAPTLTKGLEAEPDADADGQITVIEPLVPAPGDPALSALNSPAQKSEEAPSTP